MSSLRKLLSQYRVGSRSERAKGTYFAVAKAKYFCLALFGWGLIWGPFRNVHKINGLISIF